MVTHDLNGSCWYNHGHLVIADAITRCPWYNNGHYSMAAAATASSTWWDGREWKTTAAEARERLMTGPAPAAWCSHPPALLYPTLRPSIIALNCSVDIGSAGLLPWTSSPLVASCSNPPRPHYLAAQSSVVPEFIIQNGDVCGWTCPLYN